MESLIKKPEECCEVELATFERLVTEGGEVASHGLKNRILRAERLVFLLASGCVAVGAIKNPNFGYKEGIFKKAGSNDKEKYKYEIGWLYVSEAARGKGYGRELMQKIVNSLSGESFFATTREDNDSMRYLFRQFGFTKLGLPYRSDSGDYSLVLYGCS